MDRLDDIRRVPAAFRYVNICACLGQERPGPVRRTGNTVQIRTYEGAETAPVNASRWRGAQGHPDVLYRTAAGRGKVLRERLSGSITYRTRVGQRHAPESHPDLANPLFPVAVRWRPRPVPCDRHLRFVTVNGSFHIKQRVAPSLQVRSRSVILLVPVRPSTRSPLSCSQFISLRERFQRFT